MECLYSRIVAEDIERMMTVRRSHQVAARWWCGRNIASANLSVAANDAAASHAINRFSSYTVVESHYNLVRCNNASCNNMKWRKRYYYPARQSRWMSSSSLHLPFNDCQTMEEAIQMMHNYLLVATHRNLSAFWAAMPRLLQQREFWPVEKNEQVREQLKSILAHTLETTGTFGHRDLAQTTLGIAKIVKNVGGGKRRFPKDSPHQILHNIMIGNNSVEKHFIFGCMAEASISILGEFDSQAISNTVWAYATLEISHPLLFKKVAGHITGLDNLETFWPQALSNVVWAYATAKESHPELFRKVADHIVGLDNLRPFNSQTFSNTIWAYATAKEPHPKLFKKVADHIVRLDNLRPFDAQALANIVWAYATAKEFHPELFKKVADHIVSVDNLRAFAPQALANTVWAYATANEPHPKLFKKVADHIVALDKLESFTEQALSNIVWAYATAKESHPQLFKKVADHIVGLDNLRAFAPQALSNILLAYANANQPHSKLFKKLADHIVTLDNLRAFEAQALSNTVWAYATLEISHPELFKKVAEAAIKRQNEFKPQEVANFLLANATTGQMNKHLFESFASTVASLLGECDSQNLANIAWAYAVANVAAPSLFNDEFISACLEQEDEFTVEGLFQLHQWNLWQEELKSDIRLPPPLQKKCYDAFISRAPEPSAFQDYVASELESLGLQLEEEVLMESGYRLDALVEVNGKWIGIEVDGPSHFLGSEPTGSTILKHRQVTNLEGIKVVCVPFWEWEKPGKGSDKKQQYIRGLLDLR